MRILALPRRTVAATAVAAALVSGWAAPAAAQFCRAYADAALLQQTRNLEFGCGYVGLRWHRGWRLHRNWCLRAPTYRVAEEVRIRNALLRECAVPPYALPPRLR